VRDGEGPLAYARRLRAARPSLVLDLHGKIPQQDPARAPAGSAQVVGTSATFRDTLPVELALRPTTASMLFADRYTRPSRSGRSASCPRDKSAVLSSGQDDLAVADAALARPGSIRIRPLLGLSPGAGLGHEALGPWKRFAGPRPAAPSSGSSSPRVAGERFGSPLGTAVARLAPGAVDSSRGKARPGAGWRLHRRCTAFAANATRSDAHCARTGRPTLAFFGSTDPNHVRLRGHEDPLAGIPCAPMLVLSAGGAAARTLTAACSISRRAGLGALSPCSPRDACAALGVSWPARRS